MLTLIHRTTCCLVAIFFGSILLPGCTPPHHDEGTTGGNNTGVNTGNNTVGNNTGDVPHTVKRLDSGLYLGKNYDSTGTPERIVFDDTSADVFYRLKDDADINNHEYVLKIDGVNKLVGTYTTNGHEGYIALKDENITIPSSISSSQIQVTGSSGRTGPETVYKIADFDAVAVAKPGDWYCILKGTPVDYKEHNVLVHWDGCTSPSVCTDIGDNAESGVYNVESDGLLLTSAQNSNAHYKIEE